MKFGSNVFCPESDYILLEQPVQLLNLKIFTEDTLEMSDNRTINSNKEILQSISGKEHQTESAYVIIQQLVQPL